MAYAEYYVRRIRALCAQRGISLYRLSKMSGVSQSTLDNIMRGITTDPRVKTLHRIANAFGMTLAEFLDFEELNMHSFEEDVEE